MLNGGTRTPPQADVQFFDLFCGIGGASTGAHEAGLKVAFAADFCATALRSHAFNHPGSQHCQLTFPCADDAIPWPENGTEFHLHGSPPCTRLTTMQMRTEPAKIEDAVRMVRWYLELAQRKASQRWSMEQVAHPRIVQMLDEMRRVNRFVSYIVVDFAELQVPQHRRRLIAGPPWLIDNLRAFQSKQRYVPLGRAVPSMPAQAKYIRNSLVNDTRGGGTGPRLPKRKSMRRVTRPSFAVVTTIALRWYDSDQVVLRSMSATELLAVQAYPSWYSFPDEVKPMDRLRGVGNSMPPLVMALALGRRPSPVAARLGERGACESRSESEGDDRQQPLIDLAEGLRRDSPSLRCFSPSLR